MNAVDEFCELLRARLTLGQHDFPDLARFPAAYRCDELFLFAADFSDDVVRYAAGQVGVSVLREDALEVATACFQVYLATVEGGPEDGR